MSRKIMSILTLGCIIGVLGAVTVASASASSFEASKVGNLKGYATTSQTFVGNGGSFQCTKADTTGTMSQLVTQTLKITVQYGGCTFFGNSKFTVTPAEYVLHVNGELDLINPVTFYLLAGDCKLSVQPVKGIRNISFENSENKLIVASGLSHLRYYSTGGLCGASGENMTFRGNSALELDGGRLSFNP